jgi:hypothetical protein
VDSEDQHAAIEVARVGIGLSVQGLWLRYLALGGSCDAFDVDGHLQGLVDIGSFQQTVLAQAVNEALDEFVDARRVPLAAASRSAAADDTLTEVIDQLLTRWHGAPDPVARPPAEAPPEAEKDPPTSSAAQA